MSTENLIDTRLSYSSANLLRGCEQKYHNYKVAKIDKDADADKSTAAFDIGTSFHHILEMSEHKKPENIGKLLEYCVQKIGLEEDACGLVHAMVIQYLRLRKQCTLEAIACEYAIKDKRVIGFIDLIEGEREGDSWGDWWITDLKTAKTFYPTTIARLPQDRQLNLYAKFAPQIAKEHGLDIKKFKGCRYRVTTKSMAKQQSRENYNQYVMRMVDKKLVKSYDIIIPVKRLAVKQVWKEHIDLYDRSIQLRQGEAPKKNFGFCESYFKPCEWWSQCHGSKFTKMKDGLEYLMEG